MRKLAAMARVQAAALDLFERDGFDAVSIEQIAAAAEVGPATVYRNFGTKERIALWDDYDPRLLEAFTAALAELDPITALQRALSEALAEVYARDRVRILRRSKLLRRTPALQRVAGDDLRALRGVLAGLLLDERRARDALEARVFAGALVATLEAAIEHWVDGNGREPLPRCFTLAFRRLRNLVSG